jgi:hypothetical protein
MAQKWRKPKLAEEIPGCPKNAKAQGSQWLLSLRPAYSKGWL